MASSASTTNHHAKMSLLNRRFAVVGLIVLLSFAVFSEAEASYGAYKVKVINEFPHDPEAYTQGLLYAENDTLFESTGLYGRSSVRKVALQNGKVETVHEMQASDFGEGLALLGESLFQLTWLKDTGFIYDRYNFSKTDCIARISPKDGTVIGWILLQSLREDLKSRGYKYFEVLNGIAWDRDGDRIFVTGKLWPKIFEIKLRLLPPSDPLIGEINNLCIPKNHSILEI
ncbi:hypothetical protein AABB24_005656 [Solanum stoloniferum]|uniref:Glutaminyl-peptide cyclotransferase n=1 Tax=Solanum stoloniferum TaxID=62892 RepID=A0ABD2UY42_9SOLN